LLDFRVFQEDELEGVIRIAGDGTAVFPLIGTVSLGGRTVAEAIEVLKSRYRDGYLVNPQISITVREYATGKFTVLGQVKKPGAYSMTGNEVVTLLQAIGLAGGYTRIANPSSITIKRTEAGVERIMRVDAKKMARSEKEALFYVKPGDVITVGESIF
jgi:polysaccharide export outer membrane protein